MTDKTSTPRVTKSRQKAKDLGRVRREYSATADEHDTLKSTLKKLRDPDYDPPSAV